MCVTKKGTKEPDSESNSERNEEDDNGNVHFKAYSQQTKATAKAKIFFDV